MQPELAAKLRKRVGLILLVAAAAAVWWALDRWEPRADWLRVEAPRHAVAGQALPVRVRLPPRAEATYVCVDLHWGTSRDTSRGYLASGGFKAVGQPGGTFDFAITVRNVDGLLYVTPIIFLSRTGDWSDHTLVASTEVIPVSSNTVGPVNARLEPLRLQPPGADSGMQRRRSPVPRWLTGCLFLAALANAWSLRRLPAGPSTRPALANRGWQVLVWLLAAACVWELCGFESWVGMHARALARADDLYYPRAAFQKVMISVAVVFAGAFLRFVWRARPSHRPLLIGFGLYLGILLVNLVSLHVIDQVADLSWHGLTLVRALKISCAATTLRGVALARRDHSGSGP